MTTKKNGVLVGIAVIAVVGVAAVLYFSQWPPAEEDATGAIGAAERYRAEQITDEDVILDIPGQEQLAEAVFEVLTDEQKAELIGRTSEAERASYYARFDEADAFARMSLQQQGRFVLALDRAAQERVANAMRFGQADLARMSSADVGRGFANLDAEARSMAIGRFEADAALARMNTEQQGHFVLALDRAAQERVANAMRFSQADLARMSSADVGRGFANLDAEARSMAIGRFEADAALARMNTEQQGHFVLALDRAAQERVANAMRFSQADLARMSSADVGRGFANLDAESRSMAVGRFEADAALARMNTEQQGHFVLALDRAAQERVANAMRVSQADLARMNSADVGRGFANLDAEARSKAVGRFEADEALARMNTEQQGHFVLALDRAAQERVANAMRFGQADLARMSSADVGRGFANLDAEARSKAVGRFEADEALARMNTEQQGHFVLALDRAAQERVANAMRFGQADLARMSSADVGRGFANLDAEARSKAVGRFEADEALARMNTEQQGHFVLALDRAAQERVANAMRFGQADLARMSSVDVGRGFANLDAEARSKAVGRYEMNEANFERMNALQRAAFADALGSKAFERTVLRSREFNRLSQTQQRSVWDNLGRQGQYAALRYAGFEADLARADAVQRNNQFERYMQDRFSQN